MTSLSNGKQAEIIEDIIYSVSVFLDDPSLNDRPHFEGMVKRINTSERHFSKPNTPKSQFRIKISFK